MHAACCWCSTCPGTARPPPLWASHTSHNTWPPCLPAPQVSGLSSISLRKQLDLPPLPPAYLGEVYAHIKLGQPEQGYDQSPGVQFLAAQLRQMAEQRAEEALQAAADADTTTSSSKGRSLRQQLKQLPLLSLEVEPAAAGLTLAAAAVEAGAEPPRLRARRLPDNSLELSLRQSPVAAGKGGSRFSAVGHIWAWPLPQVGWRRWCGAELPAACCTCMSACQHVAVAGTAGELHAAVASRCVYEA